MLFNSLTFVVFFAVVVTAYWSIRSWNARKNLLVTSSYIFYCACNPPFASLLFSTTAMDFWLGSRIARAKGQRSRKLWLVVRALAGTGADWIAGPPRRLLRGSS